MPEPKDINPPDNLDWQSWVDRWDRMQARHIPRRTERFETIVRLIKATQPHVTRVLDLGCGTGSLMLTIHTAFPAADITGIDFDPTMLWLARARCARLGSRARIELLDLRDPAWLQSITVPVDAVVSATALHWFTAGELAVLYRQIAGILKPGGMFLNADHAGSDVLTIQTEWERERDAMLAQEDAFHNETWEEFWAAFAQALNLDIDEIRKRVIGGWEGGIEEGLPLAWHFDKLREAGFVDVDCFWRCAYDAIYGGVRG